MNKVIIICFFYFIVLQFMWLEKRILYEDDIKEITPNFDALSVIPWKVAEKSEILFFDREKKVLLAVTTNKHVNLVNHVKEKVKKQWYETDIYFVDKTGFDSAMLWYDKLKEMHEKAQQHLDDLKTAKDVDATTMIVKLYKNKANYGDTDFVKEIIRLSFVAWASDVHLQPEEENVVFRIRKDWVLKKILTFPHREFKQ